MYNAGELMGVSRIAALQQRHEDSLYYPFLDGFEYDYKLALLKRIKPDVVTIGSSLPILIDRSFIRGSFTNLGRAMIYLSGGEQLANDIVSAHAPKLVILVLNFVWFTAENPDVDKTVRGWQPKWTLRQFITPYLWLYEGRLDQAVFFDILRESPSTG